MYGLNKDGATEDGYPINKNQHHAQANIYEKNDANGPCLDMEELSQGIDHDFLCGARSGCFQLKDPF